MKLSDRDKLFFLKCAEELAELSVELLQAVNKPRKNNYKKILSEIEDAEKQIQIIKKLIL